MNRQPLHLDLDLDVDDLEDLDAPDWVDYAIGAGVGLAVGIAVGVVIT